MISHRITSADLVEVTGYSRHKLRSLLGDLPGFAERARSARVAREYTAQEMTLIAICCSLEEECGLRREAIAELEPEIRKMLGIPRESTLNARLVVSLQPPSARYIDDRELAHTGTILALSPILDRIDQYLISDQGVLRETQRSLDFGPHPVGRSNRLSALEPQQDVHAARKKHGTG